MFDFGIRGVFRLGGCEGIFFPYVPGNLAYDDALARQHWQSRASLWLGKGRGIMNASAQCSNCKRDHESGNHCGDCETCSDCCEAATCTACDRRIHDGDGEFCTVCDRCDRCCESIVCARCHTGMHRENDEFPCDNCNRCPECCPCLYCEGCETHVNSGCGECAHCDDCCHCSRSEEPATQLSDLTWFPSTKTQRKRVPSGRFLGVEIEMSASDNGYNRIRKWCSRWNANLVPDGSLPSSGMEAVTSPASGDVFAGMIEAFTVAAREDDAEVSSACGLHVHIDARDYTYFDLRRLIKLYACIEPALLATQPPTRIAGTYCTPCGERYLNALDRPSTMKATKQAIIHGVYDRKIDGTNKGMGQSFKAQRRIKYDGARYAALNLHSWFFRGTVEVRLHTGSIEAQKIIPWAALWARILDRALNMTEAEVDALVAAREQSLDAGHRLLLWLAPTHEVRQYLIRRWKAFGLYNPMLNWEV